MIKILLVLLLIDFAIGQTVTGVCFCVTAGQCANNVTNPGGGGTLPGTFDGSGQLDIRIQTSGLGPTGTTGTTAILTTATGSGITPVVVNQFACGVGLDRCCPATGYQCGVRYPPVAGARPPVAGSGQASYMAYPWQAVLLAQDSTYQGAGALIDHLHVLTVAHRLNESTVFGRPLRVRLGEWDASGATEPIPAQEYQVARVFIHPQYTASNLRNDIAILRLATPVTLGQTPSITPACLPATLVNGIRCFVAGWGKSDFSNNGQYQAVQKEVDVPLVDQNTCQGQLRLTRLGANFALDFTSFMCAGGEPGKDACTGDGGSPLVCQIGANWFVVGLVAWGIGCGTSNIPGVYVNVASYISWIQQTTRS
ncbi:hypothetical protein PVAND_016541 [Polypedilum vanderplanki]|uniref:Peptidase S1 domain-containing protein n=1 Tax=Polypedilum vanderplanki TaxID=319348 RepID=A0A9J6BFQ5_POLVA|nr:hypothetical protein PVAND_016541 [Polypedilum vanderplanki]